MTYATESLDWPKREETVWISRHIILSASNSESFQKQVLDDAHQRLNF